MAGLSIINVGRPKTGKTTKAKELLNLAKTSGSNIIVYDPNNEYSEYDNSPFTDFESFAVKRWNYTKQSGCQIKNSTILVEEATVFTSTRSTDKVLQDLLVRRRHNNNDIILNFHSFGDIPKYIFALLNYVIVFKTNDTEETIKSKTNNPKLLQAFKEVRDNSNPHYCKTFNFYS